MGIRRDFPRLSTWEEFSSKLLDWYEAPNGSKLMLRRASKGGRLYLRADVEVRRKFFRRDEHPASPSITVADICRAAEACLAPGRHSGIVALGPDGTTLSGNMLLRNWRALPGVPTREERDRAELHRQYIDELRRSGRSTLRTFEEFVDNPDSNVTEAMMGALVDRYGASSVKDAYAKLRL